MSSYEHKPRPRPWYKRISRSIIKPKAGRVVLEPVNRNPAEYRPPQSKYPEQEALLSPPPAYESVVPTQFVHADEHDRLVHSDDENRITHLDDEECDAYPDDDDEDQYAYPDNEDHTDTPQHPPIPKWTSITINYFFPSQPHEIIKSITHAVQVPPTTEHTEDTIPHMGWEITKMIRNNGPQHVFTDTNVISIRRGGKEMVVTERQLARWIVDATRERTDWEMGMDFWGGGEEVWAEVKEYY